MLIWTKQKWLNLCKSSIDVRMLKKKSSCVSCVIFLGFSSFPFQICDICCLSSVWHEFRYVTNWNKFTSFEMWFQWKMNCVDGKFFHSSLLNSISVACSNPLLYGYVSSVWCNLKNNFHYRVLFPLSYLSPFLLILVSSFHHMYTMHSWLNDNFRKEFNEILCCFKQHDRAKSSAELKLKAINEESIIAQKRALSEVCDIDKQSKLLLRPSTNYNCSEDLDLQDLKSEFTL